MSSLFERLAMPPGNGDPQAPTNTVGSIKRHLEALLNSRQGCSQSSPTLGLRDFNGHQPGNADVLSQLSEDIRRTLCLFEPRLAVLALHTSRPADAPLELHCRLECQLAIASQKQWLQIDLLVNGHSRYTYVR